MALLAPVTAAAPMRRPGISSSHLLVLSATVALIGLALISVVLGVAPEVDPAIFPMP
jgi:hypothetical protein